MGDKLVIAGREFSSRLLVGTGKFASCKIMAEAIEKSGTEIVTVALRRVDIENENDDMLSVIDRDKYLLLPNTSGARNAQEAVRLAKLARAATCLARKSSAASQRFAVCPRANRPSVRPHSPT